MRVSSTLFFQTGLNSINAQQSDLLHLYKQIGTGKRMITPSDDPLAASQSINLSQSQSLNARFSENRQVAMRSLSTAESTLSDATLLMQDIKTRLVEVSNGTLSDADRSTLSSVLKGARDSLLNMANAKDAAGQYLFSGSKGTTEPFQKDASGVVSYAGDNVQRLVQADQTRQIAASDIGTDIFSRATPGSSLYLTQGQANSKEGTSLPAGTGEMGGPQLLDIGHKDYGKTYQLEFGTQNADGTYAFTVTTTGDNPGDGPITYTGNYDPANPVLQLPPGPDPMVKVSFSGSPADGDTYQIEPAAGNDVNVFNALGDLINLLDDKSVSLDPNAAANFRTVLSTAMQRTDIVYDNVLTVRSSIGTRLNELDSLEANGDQRGLGYAQEMTRLEDLDYYTATTQLQLRSSALEAASLAFRRIQSLSLFNQGQG